MHHTHAYRQAPRPGFALVITLSLMILLTILAVGLLSLSTIALRTSGAGAATARARANARLALELAIGDLQKAVGDDRRVTADGSIFDGAKNPNVVGVWKSWSPKLAENEFPTVSPAYTTKSTQFVRWLTSCANPDDLVSQDWAKSGTLANPVNLFATTSDGFLLAGSKVQIMPGTASAGAMAWAVVQDATRAKINVGGPEDAQRFANQDLQAQPRPSLAKSSTFKQPGGNWDTRSARVLSIGQAKLDTDLWRGVIAAPEHADFTAQGMGLLTDLVNGGLKTDLNLGFEMSDSDFKADTWGTFKNPFRAATAPQLATPASYKGQRPLFHPLTDNGSVHVDLTFNPASTSFEFPAAVVPTFDTLRSFYRTPYHLYTTADGPTVFERGMDHVALKPAPTTGNISPGLTPLAANSQTSYRPVLDRVIFLLSAGVGADKEVRLIYTPIVTLWNPYNVALEIEGAVVYPWMDMPFGISCVFTDGTKVETLSQSLSNTIGYQFLSVGQGRTVNPYFFASITPTGSGIAAAGQSIRFKPGEVRVFAPTNQVDIELLTNTSVRARTIPLMPVGNGVFNTKWGFALRMKNPANNSGFSHVMTDTESVQMKVTPMTGDYYPFSVGLEDATRAKAAATDTTRGQSVADVQTVNFALTGTATVASVMQTPVLKYTDLVNPATRQPFGMIETYHRVATDTPANRHSDLVYTVNPRQAFINRYLTTGTFLAGPHYETHTRQIGSLIDAGVEAINGGRSSFYGRSNSALTGESQLSFFEVPQSPLLSLAALQHADLAGSCYSPANQFANSWASAYLKKEACAELIAAGGGGTGDATFARATMPVYDYSYLANEALWDSFFFSGAAPTLLPGATGGSPAVWTSNGATVTHSYQKTLTDFIDDSKIHPLQNPRMRFHAGSMAATDLKTELVKAEGCLKLAAHLLIDGAFNINSTSEKAWVAFLSGMRDQRFTVRNGSAPAAGMTGFPRLRDPLGTDSNNWQGFRSLSDVQMAELAKQIVVQVKNRGPFLSLAEFVNRRIDTSAMALSGAIQAAIDSTKVNGTALNQGALYDAFDPNGRTTSGGIKYDSYPVNGIPNIVPANTGVGIPGYLTQADVLHSIAPVMTARSDTFTIRGYGEAKDAAGKVTATAWCEAVVQRMPEFVDPANPAHTAIADLNPINQTFGRKFSIVSFRYLSPNEVVL
jgi:hypothetical protein